MGSEVGMVIVRPIELRLSLASGACLLEASGMCSSEVVLLLSVVVSIPSLSPEGITSDRWSSCLPDGPYYPSSSNICRLAVANRVWSCWCRLSICSPLLIPVVYRFCISLPSFLSILMVQFDLFRAFRHDFSIRVNQW